MLETTLVRTIDPSEGRVAYRSSLILTLFYKFYLAQLPSVPGGLVSATQHCTPLPPPSHTGLPTGLPRA
jgi:hypothetical protein